MWHKLHGSRCLFAQLLALSTISLRLLHVWFCHLQEELDAEELRLRRERERQQRIKGRDNIGRPPPNFNLMMAEAERARNRRSSMQQQQQQQQQQEEEEMRRAMEEEEAEYARQQQQQQQDYEAVSV